MTTAPVVGVGDSSEITAAAAAAAVASDDELYRSGIRDAEDGGMDAGGDRQG